MPTLEVHEKFQPLIDFANKAPQYKEVDTFCITGGRFSFKSYTVSALLSLFMVSYNWKILFTRYTMESAEDSVIAEVNEKIDLLGLNNRVNVLKKRIVKATKEYTDNDDKLDNSVIPQIVFKGIKTSTGNQTANLKSLKGFNCFVLDEAEEHPNYEDFKTIKRSIRRRDLPNCSILILNPTPKTHWIYKKLYQEKGLSEGANCIIDNVCYIHMTYLDMLRFVPDNILRDFEKAKETDDKDYKVNILGAFKEVNEDVAYKYQLGQFDNSLPYFYGLDFGFFPDPDACTKVGIDTKRKKMYLEQIFTGNNIKISELEKKLRALDSQIIADCNEPRTIAELRAKGINVIQATKGQNSVIQGVKMCQDYEIIVCGDSPDLIDALDNYLYSEIQKSKYKHFPDSFRYVAWTKYANRKKLVRR